MEDEDGDGDGDGDGDDEVSINWDVARLPAPLQAHAKKDAKWKVGPHRDTVSIIKAMVDAEIHGGAPIGKSINSSLSLSKNGSIIY